MRPVPVAFVLVQYAFRAAMRDRMALALAVCFAVAMSLSLFLGSSAVIEKGQFSLIFAAASMRLVSAACLVLFVTFFIRRTHDARDIDFLLAAPVSRLCILLSFAAAFGILALIMGIAQGLVLTALVPGAHPAALYGLWTLGMVAELIILSSVALFFSMMLSGAATACMATFGYYVLGRLMGQLLGIAQAGSDYYGFKILAFLMKTIAVFVPRFDLIGQSSWLIYGSANPLQDFGVIALQGAVFAGLLLTAATIDFTRRKF